MLHRLKGRGAFTLVELLVVIGIIAVLISILLPALGMARRHAQDVICESKFRQFGMAIQIYANNNRGFLPTKGPDGSNAANSFGTAVSASNPTGSLNGVRGYDDDTLWFNALPPLIDNKTYYEMCLDNYTSKGTIPPPSWQNSKSIFTCTLMGPPHSSATAIAAGKEVPPTTDYYMLWGVDSTHQIKSTSAMSNSNQFPFDMCYVWNSKLQSTTGKTDLPNLKIDNCQPASEVILMTEKLANFEEYRDDPDLQNWNNNNPAFYKTSPTPKISKLGFISNIGQAKADWTRFTTRHHGGGYLLFADGHVQWFGWSGVQYQGAQLLLNPTQADINQYGLIVWSAAGPVNSSSGQ